jgi:hypothetical protein
VSGWQLGPSTWLPMLASSVSPCSSIARSSRRM